MEFCISLPTFSHLKHILPPIIIFSKIHSEYYWCFVFGYPLCVFCFSSLSFVRWCLLVVQCIFLLSSPSFFIVHMFYRSYVNSFTFKNGSLWWYLYLLNLRGYVSGISPTNFFFFFFSSGLRYKGCSRFLAFQHPWLLLCKRLHSDPHYHLPLWQ